MGTFLGGPNNKDIHTLGSILGSPSLWKQPYFILGELGLNVSGRELLSLCRGTFGDLSSFEEGLCSGSWFMSAQVGA